MSDPFPGGLEPDDPERRRIRDELDSTLFVDAGAGSGKTTILVERVVNLVIDRGVPLDRMAVITFTEKAAAELRDRVRRAVEAAAADTDLHPDARDRARAAVDAVDGAAISTLHGFAQRLLVEHPVEAGLPPRLEVLDEVASELELTARWQRFRLELLDDPRQSRAILLAQVCGVSIDDLRALAVSFGENWDLVAERIDTEVVEPPSLLVEATAAALDSLGELAADCADADDKMRAVLVDLGELAARLRGAVDEFEQLEVLLEAPAYLPKRKLGRAGNWPAGALDEIREEITTRRTDIESMVEQTAAHAVACLAGAGARFTLDAADARRAAGRLEFHDLLVLARSLLRDPQHGAAVRRAARQRYQRLLLDEFQDTDPIQLELAVLLAADPDAAPHPERLPWDEIPLLPGRLFVVGDPKQSIYRFRRADITLYLRARERLTEGDDRGAVVLSANFRTVDPTIAWVNHVFGRLIVPARDLTLGGAQPEYQPLEAMRPALDGGPAVLLLGADEHPYGTSADEVRRAEAADVAAVLRRAVDEGWTVSERDRGAVPPVRPARWGDCAVLLPARTSLALLTEALDAAGVPWRAETSSLVYATREIRDLLSTVRALTDPSDELALVTALRSPLFGCGDDDLAEYRVTHDGRFRIGSAPPATLPPTHPVVAAMAELATLRDEAAWRSPSELLEELVERRRVREVALVTGRGRDLWRRVRFVIDQARAWSDVEGGTLRQWVAWATRQGDERSRVTETVLPETDDDSVRILTVHGAKGLEFPVTVVSGLSTRPQARRPRVQVVFPSDGGVGYRIGTQVRTQVFVEAQPIEEQLDHHERVRLLYVACTRARDHLVVSGHRAARKTEPSSDASRTHAELLVAAAEGAVHDLEPPHTAPPPPVAPSLPLGAPAPPAAPSTPDELADAIAELRQVVEVAGRRRAVSATTLAGDDPAPDLDPGLAKQARDLDLPPWLKGRYGTALGRAVHGVLQTVDLSSGEGVDAAAAAQAAAEGLFGHEAEIERLARAALAVPIVATARRSWRELYLAAPVDGVLVEGYLDLLVETDDGLVVVDYKTGDTSDLDRRLAGYRVQAGAYALLVEAALGTPVAAVRFLFLGDDGAVERDAPDLAGAVADVRRRLAGAAAATPSDATGSGPT